MAAALSPRAPPRDLSPRGLPRPRCGPAPSVRELAGRSCNSRGSPRVSVPASILEAMRAISAMLQAGQFTAAHERLEAIAEANPTFVEALRLLAGTKLALGDARSAEALLRRALELDPAWTATHTTLGELLLAGGRGSEAEGALQRALEGGRPDPRAALVLARYYNDTGRPARALAVAAPFCAPGRRLDPELATQHVTALIALG